MRIIIEMEGGGTNQPEIVLRSSSSGQSTTDGIAKSPGARAGGGIDAGPAPTGDSGAQTMQAMGTVVGLSAAGTSDAAGAQSAGAAPSSDAGG